MPPFNRAAQQGGDPHQCLSPPVFSRGLTEDHIPWDCRLPGIQMWCPLSSLMKRACGIHPQTGLMFLCSSSCGLPLLLAVRRRKAKGDEFFLMEVISLLKFTCYASKRKRIQGIRDLWRCILLTFLLRPSTRVHSVGDLSLLPSGCNISLQSGSVLASSDKFQKNRDGPSLWGAAKSIGLKV